MIAEKSAWITAKMNTVDMPNSSTPHDASIAPSIRQFAAGTMLAASSVDIVSIEKNSAAPNEPIAPICTTVSVPRDCFQRM
ncbi:hypothetical protein SB384_05830 [Burkholderia cenocepacia]|nr:hypothetical protein [Burkholderia cenocepacia]